MKKGHVDNTLPKSEKKLEFETGSNKKYKVEAIVNSAMYG